MPPLLVGFWDWWTISKSMVSAVMWQNWERNSDVLYPKPFWPLLLLFSHSVVSDSLQSHGLQHARLPCPSPTPGACSNSCPLSWWYHPTISSSVVPFSSCLQSFPGSGSFPVSQLFASGGHNIRALVSASVLSMNIQGWFPLGLTGLISLQSKGLSRVFSNTTVQKHQFFGTQPSLWSNSHITIGKAIDLTIWTFVSKVISLLFNTPARFVIVFLPRRKHLLISSLQSPSKWFWSRREYCHCFHCFPIYFPWSDGTGCHDLHFLNVEF